MTDPTEQERIAQALTRVDRAVSELVEAEQDFPPELAGLREVVRQAAEKLRGMADHVRPQYGLEDSLLARWHALKPRVEALDVDAALDQDDVSEAIALAREMDKSGDARYDEARTWFHANNLPTSWGRHTPQHRTSARR
jgi:hypothetical protein